ncbi:lysozyme inhibitor LprI family protein [Sphingomonas sp.]|uniref:lysozyme inhibitor LprI family protein n=1 Tax=Sphingomonas sp. TaxID=28214 RepID=UPI0038B287AE
MRRLNWTTIALIGGLVLLVLVVAYFATRGNDDQDKLTNSRTSMANGATNEKACASKATYDLIKRELFRRAAQLRGSDQAAYDRLSAYAVVRMENPVMESEDQSTHAVNCSGSLSLDLPPGVAVVGGRRTLSSDVDYSVQPAADGSGSVVLLRNADAIITPLATLSRVAQAPPASSAPAEQNGIAPQALSGGAIQTPLPPAAPQTPTARPSSGCANARSRGEIAVCGDSTLAALDRDMSIEYGRAVGVATPEQRDQLRQTAQRFYAYRDRCPDRQCMAAAYAGRVREIRDIIEGRWQAPR